MNNGLKKKDICTGKQENKSKRKKTFYIVMTAVNSHTNV